MKCSRVFVDIPKFGWTEYELENIPRGRRAEPLPQMIGALQRSSQEKFGSS
jgi:hypothetical protein